MNKIDSIIQEATESSVPSKPKQSKLEKISKEISFEVPEALVEVEKKRMLENIKIEIKNI